MVDIELFTLTCKACGHSFNLTDQQLYEMRSCSCPKCGQMMNKWTLYDLKRAYYSSVDMITRFLSAADVLTPDPFNFSFEVAGDPSESEDARLLQIMRKICNIPTTNIQDIINEKGESNT